MYLYKPNDMQQINTSSYHMSRVVRKPAYCICENKDADQLRGDREADQRLCFRYTDSTIPLLSKSEISSLYSSSVVVQPGLCGTWSETPKTGFLRTRLISYYISSYQVSIVLTVSKSWSKWKGYSSHSPTTKNNKTSPCADGFPYNKGSRTL